MTKLVLKEISIPETYDWQRLVPVTQNLTELRLRAVIENENYMVNLIQYIRTLQHLQLLWIHNPYYWGDNVGRDILSLLENPKLRSLSLHVVGRFATKDVLGFLTKLVEYKEMMVPRQDVLEDLTITGLAHVACVDVAEIYESGVLTPRMKDRFYTGLHYGDEAAAFLILLKRGYYTELNEFIEGSYMFRRNVVSVKDTEEDISLVMRVLIKMSRQIPWGCEDFPRLLIMLLQRDSWCCKCDESVLEDALSAVTLYINDRLFARVPTPVSYWNEFDEDPGSLHGSTFRLFAVSFLQFFDWSGVKPRNVPLYLESLVALLDGSCFVGVLPQLFMEHSRHLSRAALANCVDRRKAMLIRIFFQLICSVRPPREQGYTGYEMVKHMSICTATTAMIELVLDHAEDENLKMAARAVLRRSHPRKYPSHTIIGFCATLGSVTESLDNKEHQLLFVTVTSQRYRHYSRDVAGHQQDSPPSIL